MFEPASQDASVSGGPAQNNNEVGDQDLEHCSKSSMFVRKPLNNKATADAFRALSARLNGTVAPVNGHASAYATDHQETPNADVDHVPVAKYGVDDSSTTSPDPVEPLFSPDEEGAASLEDITQFESPQRYEADETFEIHPVSQVVEQEVAPETEATDLFVANAEQQSEQALGSNVEDETHHPTTIEEILGYAPEASELADRSTQAETDQIAPSQTETIETAEIVHGVGTLGGRLEREVYAETLSTVSNTAVDHASDSTSLDQELIAVQALETEGTEPKPDVEQPNAADTEQVTDALSEGEPHSAHAELTTDDREQFNVQQSIEVASFFAAEERDGSTDGAEVADESSETRVDQAYQVDADDDLEVVLVACEIQSSSPKRAEQDLPAELLEQVFEHPQDDAPQSDKGLGESAMQNEEAAAVDSHPDNANQQTTSSTVEISGVEPPALDTAICADVVNQDGDRNEADSVGPSLPHTPEPDEASPESFLDVVPFNNEPQPEAAISIASTEDTSIEEKDVEPPAEKDDLHATAPESDLTVSDETKSVAEEISASSHSPSLDSNIGAPTANDDREEGGEDSRSTNEDSLNQFDQSELEIKDLLLALSSESEVRSELASDLEHNATGEAPSNPNDDLSDVTSEAIEPEVLAETEANLAESSNEGSEPNANESCSHPQTETLTQATGESDAEVSNEKSAQSTPDVKELVSSIAEKFSGHPGLSSNLDLSETEEAVVEPTQDVLDTSAEFDESQTDLKSGETARMLLDIMSKPSGAAQPQERALAADTLLRLVTKIPAQSLVGISERICIMESPPTLLVNKLIRHPNAKVAGPLLETCNVISDQVLIPVIAMGDHEKQRMIARRRSLTPALCDALLKHGDPSVYLTIVRNPGASISHDAFITLSEMAKSQPSLQAPLVTRGDTPPPTAFELFWFLPSELRRYVLSRYLTDSETLDRILRIALAVDETSDPASADESRFPDRGQVAELIELIKDGPAKDAAAKLAVLAGISQANAHRILSDPDGEPLAVAMKAIGCSRTTFSEAVAGWQKSESCLLQARRSVSELQNLFDSLSFNKARVLLTYWDWASSGTGPYARKAA